MRWCWSICLLLTRWPWSTQEVPLFVSLCCAGLSPQGRLSHNLDKHLRCQEILSTWQLMANLLRWNFAHLWKCSPKMNMNSSSGHWQVLKYIDYIQIHQPLVCNMTGSHVPLYLRHQTSVHFIYCSAAILLHHAAACAQCSTVSPASAHTSQRTYYMITMVAMRTGAWQTHSINQSINQSITLSLTHKLHSNTTSVINITFL